MKILSKAGGNKKVAITTNVPTRSTSPLFNQTHHQRKKHQASGKNKLTYPVSQTQRTGRLHAPSHVLNLRSFFADKLQLVVHLPKILLREHLEARHNPFSGEVLDGPNRPGLGDLDLQRAPAKLQLERFRDVLLHLGFEDDVVAGNAKVDITFAYERGYVGSRKKDAVPASSSQFENPKEKGEGG